VQRDQRLADILLVDAWRGLRWSELRAVRVRDFIEVPLPVLVVQRAEPEGVEVKGTKSGRSRRVPVADRVLPLVRSLTAGREADDLLCVTTSGPPTARLRIQANTDLGNHRRRPTHS
jgi:integrase